MTQILLIDEEINLALAKDNFHAKERLPSYEYDFAIAKAQLKKVVGILKEREIALENDNRIFVIGDKLWQALLKEVQ